MAKSRVKTSVVKGSISVLLEFSCPKFWLYNNTQHNFYLYKNAAWKNKWRKKPVLSLILADSASQTSQPVSYVMFWCVYVKLDFMGSNISEKLIRLLRTSELKVSDENIKERHLIFFLCSTAADFKTVCSILGSFRLCKTNLTMHRSPAVMVPLCGNFCRIIYTAKQKSNQVFVLLMSEGRDKRTKIGT